MNRVCRCGGRRLVAISDIHADPTALRASLLAAGLCSVTGDGLAWTAAAGTVFVVVGDFIDGPMGAEGLWQVVTGLQRLEADAAARGSTVITLLGNHETDLLGGTWSLAPGRPQLAASLGTLAPWLRARPLLAEVGGRVLVHGGPTAAWESFARGFASAEQALNGIGLDHPLVGSGPDSVLAGLAPLPPFAADVGLRRRFVRSFGGAEQLVVGHNRGLPRLEDLVPLDAGLRHGSRVVGLLDIDLVSGRVDLQRIPLSA